MLQSAEQVQGAVADSLREALGLFPAAPGLTPIVVAVSGGLDSVTLLDILLTLATELRLQLFVAHFDHKLRSTSGRDAEFVQTLARRYGVCAELGVPADRWDERENMEGWARRERYAFLEQVREKHHACAILTAHHQDDQSETVLLRLLSGRLATDARAIARVSFSRRLIRPLLGISRQELLIYAEQRKLQWVSDETNSDLARTRNRIRHTLMPLLEREYNPSIVSDLAEVASRLGDDERSLWEAAEKLATGESARCIDALQALNSSYRWRVIALIAQRDVGDDALKLGYRRFARLLPALLLQRRVSLGFAIEGVLHEGAIRFSRSSAAEVPASTDQSLMAPGAVTVDLGAEGCARIVAELLESPDPNALIDELKSMPVEPESTAVAYFDADDLGNLVFTVRSRLEGDTLRVFNRGTRPLKKLFSERGVRLTLRKCIPIVEQGGDIIWVPGVARSHVAPLRAGTKKVLSLRYFRRPNPCDS